MGYNYNLNLAGVPKELRLILETIKIKVNTNVKPSTDLLSECDWQYYLDLVFHHRLFPILYNKIKGSEESVPSDILKTLKLYYQRNTFQMLYMSSEMEQLAKQFSENQINALFLKGPILADDLYGDISLRTSGDLDILIPIKQLDEMDHILTEKGYVKDEYIHTILNDWKWRHHHFTYFHPNKKVKLEIHWRLNPGPAKEPSFDKLWGRKRISQFSSTPIFILGKEDLFLFLILHGARHGWSRLRWLVDIKQLINQQPNWMEVKHLLKKYQCLHIAGQAIILTSQLLDTTIPRELIPALNRIKSKRLAQDAMFYMKKMVSLHSEPVPEDVAEYHTRHLYLLMSFRQKVVFKLSLLFPYSKDAETLPLPKPLHFLYFPLRPFLCLWRKTRKVLPEEARR